MLTTEHRPAPLPPRPAVGATSRVPLPEGASRWSRTWVDERGLPQVSPYEVPVDVNDRRTGHVRHVCRGFLAEESGEKVPCDQVAWLLPGAPPRFCGGHGAQLEPEASSKQGGVPWPQVWDALDERCRAAAVVFADGAAGFALDQADSMPWYGIAAQVASIPAVIAGSWWLTRWYLTRQAVKRGRLDPNDEVAGKRRRKLIAKRSRIAAYLAAAGMSWIQIADLLGLDLATWQGWTLLAALAGVGAIGSRPYLNWVDSNRKPAVVVAEEPEEIPTHPEPTELEQLRVYVADRWERFVAARGPLPGTILEGISKTSGGWSAIVVATEESDLDPEKFDSEKTLGRIARAYSVGTNMVSITADPLDANRALILVQRVSPLSDSRPWDGAGIDLATGRAYTATLDDGDRIQHEFWRPGWGAVMELIAGCTGSGKSEYLNLLLALERQSGVCVSWVGDPQMGQSMGDVRDGVDWFAPTVEEILTMLRVAVQVMLARNLTITRMRVEETRPDGSVVERRVKYVEVSPEFPLLTITIDEAHLPMGDPDHGKEIVRLLALLSKSGRKCNIKLRLITQSPLLSELKSSVLRGQLSSGLVTVFRTAGKLDGTAAWPGKMPADPGSLPAVWPNGETAAGVGYISGQKPMKMRTDYAGDVYDLMHTGAAKGLEQAVLGTAGVLYADRRKRLDAFDSMDPAELLGLGVPTIDLIGARGGEEQKGGGRDAVLRYFADLWLDGDRDPVKFSVIDANVKAVKTRALSNVVKKLVTDTLLGTEDGSYWLTERGAEEMNLVDDLDEVEA